jgi:TPR repeat protein
MGQIGKFIELLAQWKYCNDVTAYGGIPSATLWLAEAYYKGDGVKMDYTKAFELFKKLSESEEVMEFYSDVYADSCYRLSQMYTNGHGVTKNIDLAKLYYEEAVKYGCGIALYEYAKQKGML